jgi:hypothetical protein
MWTGAHSHVSRVSDLFLQCKKHLTSYTEIGKSGAFVVSKGRMGKDRLVIGLVKYCLGMWMVGQEGFMGSKGHENRFSATFIHSLRA